MTLHNIPERRQHSLFRGPNSFTYNRQWFARWPSRTEQWSQYQQQRPQVEENDVVQRCRHNINDCDATHKMPRRGNSCHISIQASWKNKANLRDLIAATGLVISNWIQIINFSARVTVKFDGWPKKTIGPLFYATLSFVHHFVAIDEFKLELQSGNAQSGSNSTIFRAVRPWNLTDDLAKQ